MGGLGGEAARPAGSDTRFANPAQCRPPRLATRQAVRTNELEYRTMHCNAPQICRCSPHRKVISGPPTGQPHSLDDLADLTAPPLESAHASAAVRRKRLARAARRFVSRASPPAAPGRLVFARTKTTRRRPQR